MAFSIRSIPDIMRERKWPIGAAVMDDWFSREVAIAPDYGLPDTTSVTMKWVLGFKRAKAVFDQAVKERFWVNPAAQKVLTGNLARSGLLKPMSRGFGKLDLAPQYQHDNSVNYRTVGFSWNDLDDMSAALGNFAFHVLPAGFVTSGESGHRFKVVIKEIGIYVRDSYDFKGDQPLGYWDADHKTMSMINPFSGTRVSNADFVAWRREHFKGGDFLIFSDIQRMTLPEADSFLIK